MNKLAALLLAAIAPPCFAAGADPAGNALDHGTRPLEFEVTDLIAEVQDIGGAVQDLKMKETDTEIRIELSGDVLFDFDKADIRPEAERQLQQVAELIGKYPRARTTIDGHTDAKGDDDYNRKLSQRRADAVKRWLAAHGAGKGSIATKGWGEAKPVVPNAKPDGSDDPEGRQKNRRVEILVKK